MITVEEASRIIFENLLTPAIDTRPLTEVVGCVLAENITVDRDLPPFDRVTMDGIAINFDQWTDGRRKFAIEGTQAAGEPQKSLVNKANCFEVMTGAMLPGGCDTVIRYEDVEILDGEAIVKVDELQQGQSVHKQGVDAKTGEVVLERGQKLASSEIALLASVGKTRVDVLRPARVAVISTGDELVAVEDTPKPWQIRRSNSYALQAALRESGVESRSFHLEDDPEVLKAGLTDITRDFEVMILSGGVSKGRFDYVPQTLEAIGIKKLFHQVSQRPGKPFWFGAGNGKIAFALPGNPVSTFMCFYKYIKPWLLRSMGVEVGETFAVLGKDFTFPPPLTFFLQVSVRNDGGRLVATPVPGGGSGDFANLKNVDGFLELPLEKGEFRSGEVFRYIPFRH